MALPVTSSSSPFRAPSPSLSASTRPLLPPPQLHFLCQNNHFRLRTSQRMSSSSQESDVSLKKSRRSGMLDFVDEYTDDDDDDEEDEVEGEDRSLDLLIRFVDSVFKKVSRRARKAVRSVLPVTIPTKLVNFAVNGALVLAFLWVLKAFLQVVCTLGSVYFISILLIRGVWSGIAYFQESHNFHLNQVDSNSPAWTRIHPAS